MKDNDGRNWRFRSRGFSGLMRGRGRLACGLILTQLLVVALVYRARHPGSPGLDAVSSAVTSLPRHRLGGGASSGAHTRLDGRTRAIIEEEVRKITLAIRSSEEGMRISGGAYLDDDDIDVQLDAQQLPHADGKISRRGHSVDTPWGAQHETNLIGVEDAHEELAAMTARWRRNATRSGAEAASRQHCVPSAEAGSVPADGLADLRSVPARLRHVDALAAEAARARPGGRVGLVATTAADIWGLRRELLPWMTYHAAAGVSHFYVQYDGTDARAVRALSFARHVTLLHLREPWADAAAAAARDAVLESARTRASGGGGGADALGGNYRLMAIQSLGASRALEAARADGIAWLAHIDPDELLYPDGVGTSIPALLAEVPEEFPAARFMNHEAQAEAADVVNPYEQVTLFRAHKHFVTPEAHWHRGRLKLGDSPTFLLLYANGKSAVRVDAPGARPLGPHFWSGDTSPRWRAEGNERGGFRSFVVDNAAVLHYAYTREADVLEKAMRSCPSHRIGGVGGNEEVVASGGGGSGAATLGTMAADSVTSGYAMGRALRGVDVGTRQHGTASFVGDAIGSSGLGGAGTGTRLGLSGGRWDEAGSRTGPVRGAAGHRRAMQQVTTGADASGMGAGGGDGGAATGEGSSQGGSAVARPDGSRAIATAAATPTPPPSPRLPEDDKAALKTDCFIIDVDRDAFIAARQGPEAARDFFRSRMALCEGSRMRCADAHGRPGAWCTIEDVARYTFVLTKLGLYRRIRGPSILLAAQEREVRAAMRAGDDAWMDDAEGTAGLAADVLEHAQLGSGAVLDASGRADPGAALAADPRVGAGGSAAALLDADPRSAGSGILTSVSKGDTLEADPRGAAGKLLRADSVSASAGASAAGGASAGITA